MPKGSPFAGIHSACRERQQNLTAHHYRTFVFVLQHPPARSFRRPKKERLPLCTKFWNVSVAQPGSRTALLVSILLDSFQVAERILGDALAYTSCGGQNLIWCEYCVALCAEVRPWIRIHNGRKLFCQIQVRFCYRMCATLYSVLFPSGVCAIFTHPPRAHKWTRAFFCTAGHSTRRFGCQSARSARCRRSCSARSCPSSNEDTPGPNCPLPSANLPTVGVRSKEMGSTSLCGCTIEPGIPSVMYSKAKASLYVI